MRKEKVVRENDRIKGKAEGEYRRWIGGNVPVLDDDGNPTGEEIWEPKLRLSDWIKKEVDIDIPLELVDSASKVYFGSDRCAMLGDKVKLEAVFNDNNGEMYREKHIYTTGEIKGISISGMAHEGCTIECSSFKNLKIHSRGTRIYTLEEE